ncbi:MAG: TGS domain-containing protein [Candidatus Eisenbacteria bacterium]|nr:TGS domain-containing protein [Candidatus Eisenbacteria bacterium]
MPMSHRDIKKKIARETRGKSPAEEIRILEGYLRDWPEFKGPYQELRKKYEARLAELRRVMDVRSDRGVERDPFCIRKRGLGSVALVGLPNSGKSTLASSLSGSVVESADYPFSTLKPNVVMMRSGEIAFEIIDLPPVANEPISTLSYSSGLKEAVRNATLLGLVIDLTGDVERSLLILEERLGEMGVRPVYGRAEAAGGADGDCRRSMIFATRADVAREGARDTPRRLRPGASVTLHPLEDDGFDDAVEKLCALLGMIVVAARDPAEPEEPVTYALREGATVRDLADRVHHELARRARRAKVWGASAAFPGQEVGLDHELSPGDVVEVR